MIQSVTVLIHILACYFFVHTLDLGLVGVSYATNVTFTLDFVCIFILSNYNSTSRRCLKAYDKDIINRLRGYFAIGLPSAVMIQFDMWAFALLTLVAHYLGIDENAA